MKSVTIYTGPLCNYCDAAKRLLVRNNLTMDECLKVAYEDIKNRKGKMVDGVFVKEGDN